MTDKTTNVAQLEKFFEFREWVYRLEETMYKIDGIVRKVWDSTPWSTEIIVDSAKFRIWDGMLEYNSVDDQYDESSDTRKFPVELLDSYNVKEDATKWAREFYKKQLNRKDEIAISRKKNEITQLKMLRKKYPNE